VVNSPTAAVAAAVIACGFPRRVPLAVPVLALCRLVEESVDAAPNVAGHLEAMHVVAHLAQLLMVSRMLLAAQVLVVDEQSLDAIEYVPFWLKKIISACPRAHLSQISQPRQLHPLSHIPTQV
jgi:hypothetical protein